MSPMSPQENSITANETTNATQRVTPARTDEPFERQLSDGEKSALTIAEKAIARAALTDEQKAARVADLRRDPVIARFWALAWPEGG